MNPRGLVDFPGSALARSLPQQSITHVVADTLPGGGGAPVNLGALVGRKAHRQRRQCAGAAVVVGGGGHGLPALVKMAGGNAADDIDVLGPSGGVTSTDPRTPAEFAALYAAREAHDKKLTTKRRIDAERWMAEVKKRKEKRK